MYEFPIIHLIICSSYVKDYNELALIATVKHCTTAQQNNDSSIANNAIAKQNRC